MQNRVRSVRVRLDRLLVLEEAGRRLSLRRWLDGWRRPVTRSRIGLSEGMQEAVMMALPSTLRWPCESHEICRLSGPRAECRLPCPLHDIGRIIYRPLLASRRIRGLEADSCTYR